MSHSDGKSSPESANASNATIESQPLHAGDNVSRSEESATCLPDIVNSILDNLSDQKAAQDLKHILLENMRELAEQRINCERAHLEVEQIRERLQRTEVELSDVRSAAALMVACQDDALINLQRRYDEELASWRSISEQQVADVKAASQMLLEHERATWAGERNVLLSRVGSVQRKHSLDEAGLVGGGSGVTTRSTQGSDKPTGQNLANQALESVERMARRVRQKVLPNSLFAEDESHQTELAAEWSRVTETARISESDSSLTMKRKLELYEREVQRLRQLLNGANPPTSTAPTEAISGGLLPSTGSVDIKPNSTTEVRPLVDANSSCEVGESQSVNPHTPQSDPVGSDLTVDVKSPITETSWVQLQARLKDVPRQSCTPCVMCVNYEQQLQTLQLSQQEKNKTVQALEREVSRLNGELAESVQTREQLQFELKTRTSGQAERIDQLESRFALIHKRIESVLANYRAHRQATETELSRLTRERQAAKLELDSLQMHYDALLGRRSAAAAELSERPIQLPSDKSELELLALRMYEENLSLREAREHLDEQLKSQNQFHQQQLVAERQERTNLENSLERDLDEAHARLASLTDVVRQRDAEASARSKAEEEATQARTKLTELQSKLTQAEQEAADARAEVATLQQRIVTLQSDLDNVESVQADFVRLSQNLQVQLERLRQQDHEVRWVDPDDVSTCFACNSPFPASLGADSSGRKTNCRHCGKVHCAQCLKNSMPSGPLGRPACVCDVCHTLLNKHVAPYFSTSFHDPSTGAKIRVGSPSLHRNSLNKHGNTVVCNDIKKSHSQSPQSGRTKPSDLTNRSS